MNTRHYNPLALLAAGLILVTPAFGKTREASANPSNASATKTTTIDLRPRMKQMKLKDGPNVVYQGNGYKLIAEARGGKVTRWSATDLKGKSLPVAEEKGQGGGGKGDTKPIITCMVCVTIKTGDGSETKTCSAVDCSILTKQ